MFCGCIGLSFRLLVRLSVLILCCGVLCCLLLVFVLCSPSVLYWFCFAFVVLFHGLFVSVVLYLFNCVVVVLRFVLFVFVVLVVLFRC